MARMPALHIRVLLVAFSLTGCLTVRASKGATSPDEERDRESNAETPCEVKIVTVSTLPVLRENEFSFTGGASGSVVGGGGSAAAAAGAGAVPGGGTGGGGGAGGGGGGESRLLLFVRTDLPGRISVMDDLDNTALPYFTLGKNCCGTLFALHDMSRKPSTEIGSSNHTTPGIKSPNKIELLCLICNQESSSYFIPLLYSRSKTNFVLIMK